MALRFLPVLAAARVACITQPDRLRVLTYNVHAWRDSDHRDNFAGVVAACRAAEPDVVCLNEVLHPYNGALQSAGYFAAVKDRKGVGLEVVEAAPDKSYLHLLAAQLDMPHVAYGEAERDGCFFGRMAFGNAILSKRPFVKAGHLVVRPDPGDERLGDQARDSVEARGMVWCSVEVGAEKVGVASAHLDHKSEPLRAKQLRAMLERLNAEGPALNLVCGDLNTFRKADHSAPAWRAILAFYASRGWPAPAEESETLEAAEALGYGDAAEGFRNVGVTCWTHRPLFRIDHVLLNAALRRRCDVLDYARPDSIASDHFPVVFELEVR